MIIQCQWFRANTIFCPPIHRIHTCTSVYLSTSISASRKHTLALIKVYRRRRGRTWARMGINTNWTMCMGRKENWWKIRANWCKVSDFTPAPILWSTPLPRIYLSLHVCLFAPPNHSNRLLPCCVCIHFHSTTIEFFWPQVEIPLHSTIYSYSIPTPATPLISVISYPRTFYNS